jgi:hypothetical protein
MPNSCMRILGWGAAYGTAGATIGAALGAALGAWGGSDRAKNAICDEVKSLADADGCYYFTEGTCRSDCCTTFKCDTGPYFAIAESHHQSKDASTRYGAMLGAIIGGSIGFAAGVGIGIGYVLCRDPVPAAAAPVPTAPIPLVAVSTHHASMFSSRGSALQNGSATPDITVNTSPSLNP